MIKDSEQSNTGMLFFFRCKDQQSLSCVLVHPCCVHLQNITMRWLESQIKHVGDSIYSCRFYFDNFVSRRTRSFFLKSITL